MSKHEILVTAAAGKTGGYVVEQLLAQGFAVRAMVRQHDERSEALTARGASVVVGDFLDLDSIRAAVRGVERLYFCYPPQGDRLVEATAILAAAARDAGVKAVVNMSQITVRENPTSTLTRHHWLSEQIFDWAGVGAVHIRPTYFAEMLLILGAHTIASEGKLYLPYGDERHAPVAAVDIARVVTALLTATDPTAHVGQRYVLTGPRNLTIAEMAGVLTKGLDRPVEYVDLPIDVWEQVLTEQMGQPEFLVKHLTAVAQDHRDGVFNAVTDTVEQLTSQAPQSLEAFVQDHAAEFMGASELQPIAAAGAA